jgi:hypothetical protein
MALGSERGRRQRALMLQAAASLSKAQLDQVTSFVVAYIGDRLDQLTQGKVMVYEVNHYIQVDIQGPCAILLPATAPIVADLYELLEAELGIPFTQTLAPACGTKVNPPAASQPGRPIWVTYD